MEHQPWEPRWQNDEQEKEITMEAGQQIEAGNERKHKACADWMLSVTTPRGPVHITLPASASIEYLIKAKSNHHCDK